MNNFMHLTVLFCILATAVCTRLYLKNRVARARSLGFIEICGVEIGGLYILLFRFNAMTGQRNAVSANRHRELHGILWNSMEPLRNSMETPWNLQGTSWNFKEPHRTSMETQWNLHATSMEFYGTPWNLHGTFMETPWRLHGAFMEFHGGSMELHGTSMELHGILWNSKEPPWTLNATPWKLHATSWNFMELNGTSMEPLWKLHGILYNSM